MHYGEYKNYDKYHNSTARKAIWRANKAKRRGRGSHFGEPLAYRFGELPGFPVILK